MRVLLISLFLTLTGFAFGQSESKCFEADSLSGAHSVAFKIEGNKLVGTFTVESNDSEMVKTYDFTGTRTGNVLKVKFAEGEMPDLTPSSELKSLNWTLVKNADKEILRIKLYGKNHVTNEYKNYFANFESCELSYTGLLKMAKSIRLYTKHAPPKGVVPTLTYGERIALNDIKERKVFSMSVFQGLTLRISAEGCKISVYLPDKKLYKFAEWEAGNEKTFTSSAIDSLTIKPTPQTGAYIVVLQKMAEAARPDVVRFSTSR